MATHPDIKKWLDLRKKAKKITNTTRHEHSRAYLNASENHLKDSEGNIDYDKLDDSKVQDAFTKSMTDHYVSKAKQFFGSSLDKGDKMKVDLLMDAYGGVTSTELGQMLKEGGKGYTLQTHEAHRNQFVGKVHERLSKTAQGHLTDKHVDDIVKYVKADDIVDSKRMQLSDAINIHDIYASKKGLSKEIIQEGYHQAEIRTPYRHFLKKGKKK